MKSHIQKMGLVGSGLFVGFFVLCMMWGVLITEHTLTSLHLQILQITYPGFGYSFSGVLAGLIESVIYGFLFGVLFAWLCRICCMHEK